MMRNIALLWQRSVVLGVYGMHTANGALHDVYSNQMASALRSTDTKNDLNRARFVVDRGVFHPEADDLEKTLGRADDFLKRADKVWQEYLVLPMKGDERTLATDLAAKRDTCIDSGVRALMKAIRDKDLAKIDDLAMKRMSTLYGTFDDASIKLEQFQLKSAADTFAGSPLFYDRLLNGSSAAILPGLAFIFASRVLLLCAIMTPLAQGLEPLR